MTVSKNVLMKIKDNEIKPVPKWKFLLKNYFIWSLFIVNLIVGSISAGIVFLIISSGDLVNAPLYSIPFVWIFLTTIFIAIAVYNFRHSERGYKHALWKVIMVNLSLSIIIGLFLNVFGVAQKLNSTFSENIPIYNHTMDMRSKIWQRPEEGYLAGQIIEINTDDNILILMDLNNDKWEIDYSSASIRPRIDLRIGEEIKLTGSKKTDNQFYADDIRPWNSFRFNK